MHCIILKCFTMKGTVLLNFLMKKKTKNCTITELSQYKEFHSVIKMDAIFMNSENSKNFEPHVLILKLD